MKLGKYSFARKLGLVLVTLGAAFLTSSTISQAAIATLTDGNTTALVDLSSSAGMYQWTVDGINHLNQQWFWYRVGTGSQASIDTIGSPVWYQSAGNKLNTTYGNGSFSVQIDYSLVGGGPGHADVLEGITIHNATASTLNLTFYQYSDFNLLNDPNGDQVMMDNTTAYQWKGPTQIAEGIISPDASAFEANTNNWSGSTLNRLATQSNLTLNTNGVAGPADVTWAFQWNLAIPENGDAIITKDKMLDVFLVPEPSALALFSLGMAAFVLRRRARA